MGASRSQNQGQLSIDLAEGRGRGSMGWQEAAPSLLGQVPSWLSVMTAVSTVWFLCAT